MTGCHLLDFASNDKAVDPRGSAAFCQKKDAGQASRSCLIKTHPIAGDFGIKRIFFNLQIADEHCPPAVPLQLVYKSLDWIAMICSLTRSGRFCAPDAAEAGKCPGAAGVPAAGRFPARRRRPAAPGRAELQKSASRAGRHKGKADAAFTRGRPRLPPGPCGAGLRTARPGGPAA